MISLTLVLTVGISLAQARQRESLLTGVAKVINLRPGTCSAPDRLRICQDRTANLHLETSDDRLNGSASLLFDTISDNRSMVEQSMGFFRLQNEAGAWVGSWAGSIDHEGQTLINVEAFKMELLAEHIADLNIANRLSTPGQIDVALEEIGRLAFHSGGCRIGAFLDTPSGLPSSCGSRSMTVCLFCGSFLVVTHFLGL